jgi:hypothetical protein
MRLIHHKNNLYIARRNHGITIYNIVSGKPIRTFAQSRKDPQSICIINDRLFLGKTRIYEFSLDGKYIKSWSPPVKCSIRQIRGYKNHLFIAAGVAGVLSCTLDGFLVKQIKTIRSFEIEDAFGIDIDDQHMIIQDFFLYYICTPEGEYIQSILQNWWIDDGGVELTPQFLFFITVDGQIQVHERGDYSHVTTIKAKAEAFCVIEEKGCIVALQHDESINVYCLKGTTTITTNKQKTTRTCTLLSCFQKKRT